MKMRAAQLFVFGSLLPSLAGAAVSVLPQRFPAERYQKMLEDSPFAVATPVVAPVEAAPNFAANLYVMGIAKMRDSEGKEKDFVTIKSRADQTTFSLSGSEPNAEGISISGIEWSERVGKSKVTIKKGGEFGTLEFDQANLQSPAPLPNAATRPGTPPQGAQMPQQQRPTGQMLPNNGQPMIGGQRPANRLQPMQPVVPRPNSVPPIPNQPQMGKPAMGPGVAPNPSADARRRIRVINSNP